MLSLTRKVGESVIIGDNIEVIVSSIKGDQIKLGFIAPKEVGIYRKEIFEQIQLENLNATKNATPTSLKEFTSKINSKVKQ